jgi:DNA-binding IclR family transcriptional regulator
MLLDVGGSMSLCDLGLRAGLNRAATYRPLESLLKHGWATRDNRSGYRLGSGLVAFAGG